MYHDFNYERTLATSLRAQWQLDHPRVGNRLLRLRLGILRRGRRERDLDLDRERQVGGVRHLRGVVPRCCSC